MIYVFIMYPVSAFKIWHECYVLHQKTQIQIYHSDFIISIVISMDTRNIFIRGLSCYNYRIFLI